MLDFIKLVKNVLEEQDKTTENLFNDKVVSENTFYKYKHRFPSLKTLIKIANYLCVNIDYLFELSDENNFRPYLVNQQNFYNNLIFLIKNAGISYRQFCKELNYSRENITRWKNGTEPSVQTILEIAKYFSCSTDDLLVRESSI